MCVHQKKTLTFADKTSNMYWLHKVEYRHLLQNALPTIYKESNKVAERRINCEGIKYAKDSNVIDKIKRKLIRIITSYYRKKFQTNKTRIYRKFSMYFIHIIINQND